MGTSPFQCCGDSCLIMTDDFQRANGADVGCKWNEVSGNWEIRSSELYEPGNPGAVLLSTVQAPNADNIYITVWAVGSSTGMSYTIYLDYVNSNQYHKAVFTRGSGNLWTVGIYDGTTLLGSVTMTDLGIFPNRTILSACLHNGIFRARIDPAPVYEEEVWVDDEADHGGTLFGLRHDNSTPTKFDDFTANQVILGDFHRCYGCRCRCDDEPMCKSLNIEIDATGLGSCLDGISTTLEWEKDATGMEYWSGTLDLGADGAWGVKFLCGNGGPETHLLVITSGPCSSPNGGLPMDPLSGSGTCHPLALRFGPIILANTDGFCWICGSGPSPPNPSVTGEAYFDVTGSCW